MNIEELKQNLGKWSRIELIAPRKIGIIKKGWIKAYDLNDVDFDSFDSFDILVFTDKYKIRANLSVPGLADVIGDNEKVKELLLQLINKDLKEGFTLNK